MTTSLVAAGAFYVAGMTALAGSLYAETVVRRRRARKRAAELRRRLVVIDGGQGSTPVHTLAATR